MTTANSEILIYQSPVDNIKIDVHLENKTVWLAKKLACLRQTGRQVAELFQTTVPKYYMHLKSIYEECDLEERQLLMTSYKFKKRI